VGVLLLAPAFWQRVALLPASGLLLAPVAFSFDLSSRLMARAVGPAPFSREATDRLGTFGDPSGHPLLILGTAVVLAL
ncbi:hypothetical protein NL494_28540, partial [Klebsiella pneumoniae]|nr:hypothetical protein [Klebsiella pneumoniae]